VPAGASDRARRHTLRYDAPAAPTA
jgi:hypothetical protein